MTEPETVARPGAALRLHRDAPAWGGLACAAVGGLEFEDPDAAVDLLSQTIRKVKDEGFGGLIGPMDGDTWHSYRTITQSDGSLPFAMEPRSGRYDHAALVAVGFEPISNYLSARARLVDTIGAEPVRMEGVSVTAWDGTGAEQLIARLFAVSGQAFAGNHFFKPIGLEAFLDLYRPILPMLDPRHILFAHNGSGDLVGFLFGFPDRLGGEKPAAVLKTYASGLRGVGHVLADQYHRRALDMGYEEVIHALMHETNISSERSARHNARIFRRYALMGRRL
ncbi:hypothetical protein [Devosia nitrariae]|uniref:Uncharacterized protein n=1 Tax=Devosia nitrariae TaxID=2071872 RepID=A0ABQ5VYM0_9HYPH|nr:hypothetical protein [Devosia nitrariae]GLQ52873.1 hypothetical protein GCM10010862_01310 [Devosia nitrariae]